MFGYRTVAVIFKEYKQMLDMKVLSGVNTDSIMAEKNERYSGQLTV